MKKYYYRVDLFITAKSKANADKRLTKVLKETKNAWVAQHQLITDFEIGAALKKLNQRKTYEGNNAIS